MSGDLDHVDTVNHNSYSNPDHRLGETSHDNYAVSAKPNNACDQQLELDWGPAFNHSAVKHLSLDTPDPPAVRLLATKKSVLSAPLNQEQPCELNQVERIHHLEQALDQCQGYINELKLQLMNQEFLKDQLAATEEISHIQQQAITALKTQLAETEALGTQFSEVNQQQLALEAVLLEVQNTAQVRQGELEQLRVQLDQEQAEAQASKNQLEQQIDQLQEQLAAQQQHTQTLESQEALAQRLAGRLSDQFGAAQEKVEVLQGHLSDRQASIIELELQLQRSKASLAAQQEVLIALQKTQAPGREKNQVIQGLSKNLLNAHTKIEALETEFSSQLMLQAKLQHSCQELEGQSDRYKNRINQLEQQIAEMQEQILMQAQQASEYEAAVQHWKDQCLCAEHSVLQLKALLEQILKERNFSEFATSSTGETSGESPIEPHLDDSEPVSFLKNLKLDFPFLHLRRHPKS